MESPLVKKKQFIINTIYFSLIGLIAYTVLKFGISLISPFVFAFLIASILKRPAEFLSRKIRIPRKMLSFFLVLIFYSTVGVIIALLGVKLVSAISAILSSLPGIYENQLGPFLTATLDGIQRTVYRIDPNLAEAILAESFNQFVSTLGENVTNISLSLVGSLSNIASSLPVFFIKILLMIISTFFIAIDYQTLSAFVSRQFTKRGNEILYSIKQYMVNTLFVVIRSYALIMSVTFVELSLGFTIIGFENAVLIALVIAVFDILPVLGTGGIMIPWSIMTLIQGNYETGIGLIIIYIIVTVVRNILEPKIVGSQLGLHPVVTLMSMFVGANLLGVIGLFGFPITLSLLKYLNDSGTIKLFK